MPFRFDHRQAEVVRVKPADEERVAVEHQVLRRHGRGDPSRATTHELHTLAGRDVLEHHPETGKAIHQRFQHAIDEGALAVEDVDLGIGQLAVHQKGYVVFLHGGEHGFDPVDRADPGIRVGGGAGRVELDRRHDPVLEGCDDLIRSRAVRQVQGHQRLEIGAVGQSLEDSLPIGRGILGADDRRPQIGHHDGAGKDPCRVPDNICHGRAVAQMEVHIIGTRDSDPIAHGCSVPWMIAHLPRRNGDRTSRSRDEVPQALYYH